jgi:hypothetical protein
MNRWTKLILPSIGAALSTSAFAADAPDCRNGIFVEEGVTYGLAKVTGADRLFFIEDTFYCDKDKQKGACPVCPSDNAACLSKSYVLPGDLVITARSFNGYRCILYRNEKNFAGSAGYVPEGRLEALPAAQPTQKDWLGAWRMGDDSITLRAKGDKLSASGEAYWPSANPSPKEVPGGPHTGQMSGVAAPKGNQAAFSDAEDECHVSLTLLPPFLLAHDNDRCGGMNVRFDGVYLRAGKVKSR